MPLFPPDGHSYSAKFEARSTAVAAAAVAAGAEGESAGRGRPQGEGDPSGPRSRQGAAWSGGSETRPIGGTPAGAGARDVGGGVESQDGRSSAGVRRGEGAAGMADAGASGADSARWSTQSVGTATRADAGAGAAWGKEEKGGDGRGSHVAVKAPKRPVVSVPSSPSRLGSTLPAAGQPR